MPKRSLPRPYSSLAAGSGERSDARRRGRSAALEIISDIPERTVVRWIDDDVGEIFPAQAAGLRGLALGKHRLMESKLTFRVFG